VTPGPAEGGEAPRGPSPRSGGPGGQRSEAERGPPGPSPQQRRGPEVEIRRGSWEERLAELLAGAARSALVLEPGPANAALAAAIRPRLPAPLEIAAPAAPLRISDVLPALLAADAESPLAAICVVGQGDRDDARKAGFRLGPLAARLWIFVHRAAPPSGLVPTIGEKVARYLDVIDGLAFSEGPRGH
jgi:hypothetical protein